MTGKHQDIEEIKPNLEIDEHIHLHKRSWKVQRIGWILIYTFIAAAALGLFGDGWLSKRKIINDAATVEYDRFFRQEAYMQFKVNITASDNTGAIVSFPNEYLKHFKIASITPEPKENNISGKQVNYYFPGAAPMNIVFYLSPQTTGNVEGNVAVNNNRFTISHFIYP